MRPHARAPRAAVGLGLVLGRAGLGRPGRRAVGLGERGRESAPTGRSEALGVERRAGLARRVRRLAEGR
jgi:hypothetical protein